MCMLPYLGSQPVKDNRNPDRESRRGRNRTAKRSGFRGEQYPCMPSTSGAFGTSPNIKQCTAMSKRSGNQCKGPAVLGSVTQKCRMHGGGASHAIGPRNSNYKTGRHSKYLPAKLAELYEEALANPDLIDMSDHIALLEARVQMILEELDEGDPIPHWGDIRDIWAEVLTALVGGKAEDRDAAIARMEGLLENGIKWDRTWVHVTDTLEQLRKITDTEVKRKKELHQMVPIERVTIMMGAVGDAVKRNVTNPAEIDAVYREISTLYGGTSTKLVGPEVIDIPTPEKVGPTGGRSKPAIRRLKKVKELKLKGTEAV